MGCYMFVSEEDRITKRKVDDEKVNESFQEALKCDPSLMIEEHKRYKKKWFRNEYKVIKVWWNIYHETPALDGSAYQARWQISASGANKQTVIAYLHGIINGVTHFKFKGSSHCI